MSYPFSQVWPHKDYPLIPVGKLVLNRNPVNYFAEVEQLAFDPSNMPPGIEPSPDKMLQVTARFFLLLVFRFVYTLKHFSICVSKKHFSSPMFLFRADSSPTPTHIGTGWEQTTYSSLSTVLTGPVLPTTSVMVQCASLTTRVSQFSSRNCELRENIVIMQV